MPTVDSILSSACASGIGRVTNPVALWQAIASLENTRSAPAPEHSPEVIDWLARVAAAGGASPSESTANALDDFIAEVAPYLSKLKNVNAIVPDNLIAAGTPLINVYGTDTWTNFNFVAGDLSVDGIIGNGSTKYFRTGVIPSDAFAADSFGVACYAKSNLNGGAEAGGYNNVTNQSMQFYCNFVGSTYFDCWSDNGGGRINGVTSAFSGYLTGQRTSNTNTKIYRANSVTAHAQVATGASSGGSRPTVELYVFAINVLGVAQAFSVKRLSFVAFSDGLTTAESAAFYAAIQNLRVLLGGGFT